MKLLNIGCGLAFHPAWGNLGLVAQAAGVIETALSKGLPHPDNLVDATYSSHVVNHLRVANPEDPKACSAPPATTSPTPAVGVSSACL